MTRSYRGYKVALELDTGYLAVINTQILFFILACLSFFTNQGDLLLIKMHDKKKKKSHTINIFSLCSFFNKNEIATTFYMSCHD